MRALLRLFLLGSLFALVTAAWPAGARPPGSVGFDSGTQTRDCEDGDSVTLDGASKLWPPNHKYVDYTAAAVEDDPDGEPTLQIYGSNSDVDAEGTEKPGSGPPNNGPDANNIPADAVTDSGDGSDDGRAEIHFQLRAERSGQSREGRVYTIDFTATFDDGSKACTTVTGEDAPSEEDFDTVVTVDPFHVCVPHDMRPAQRSAPCDGDGLPLR